MSEVKTTGRTGGVRMGVTVAVGVGGTGVSVMVGVAVGTERVARSRACWKASVSARLGVGLPAGAASAAGEQALRRVASSITAASRLAAGRPCRKLLWFLI